MRSGNSRSIELVPEEVLFIHFVGIDIVFEEYSSPREPRGLRDKGELLASALARPFHGYGDKEFYPNVFDKAAALLHGLTNNHPFVDGNKRTALLATVVFLTLNGYDLNATQSQLVRLMRATAYGMSVPSIKVWLKNHSRPLRLFSFQKSKDQQFARRKGRLITAMARIFGNKSGN